MQVPKKKKTAKEMAEVRHNAAIQAWKTIRKNEKKDPAKASIYKEIRSDAAAKAAKTRKKNKKKPGNKGRK
jgi:hypothetical protein